MSFPLYRFRAVDDDRVPLGVLVVGVAGSGQDGGGALVELGSCQDTGAGEHRLQRLQPAFVVAPRRTLVVALPSSDGADESELELAPVVVAVLVGGDGQREGAELPRLVEAQVVSVPVERELSE
jgi:hypothetical protein